MRKHIAFFCAPGAPVATFKELVAESAKLKTLLSLSMRSTTWLLRGALAEQRTCDEEPPSEETVLGVFDQRHRVPMGPILKRLPLGDHDEYVKVAKRAVIENMDVWTEAESDGRLRGWMFDNTNSAGMKAAWIAACMKK